MIAFRDIFGDAGTRARSCLSLLCAVTREVVSVAGGRLRWSFYAGTVSAFLFLPSLSFAQSVTVSCGKGANTVAEGASITCTASGPVSWSLVGTGTLNKVNSTTAVYTAPSSVTPQNIEGGCPVLPNDTIFNTRIDNLPVNANSATWVNNLGANGINFILSWGTTLADNTTPTGTLKPYYPWGAQPIPNFVLPTTPALKRENGAFRSHYDNNDHHQITVRTTDCTFWEIYNTYMNDLAPTNGQCQDGSYGCTASSAIAYPWSNYAVIGGTDAAGFPLAATTLHLDELENGTIHHAMRFTSCLGCIYSGHDNNNPVFLWPAASNGGCSDGYTNVVGNPCSDSPPYGARFRLRVCDGSSVTTNCVTPSSFSPMAQNLIDGLHQYGMFLGDIGTEQQITINSDILEDPKAMAALASVSGIPMSYFDVVDESSLQYAPASLQVCPYNATCVGGANSYEQPLNQAIVVATPAAGGSAVNTSIAVQGIGIGLNSPMLYMMAGNYSYQIPYWVEGTANQGVNWSLVSGVGSVTPNGIYTPPPNVTVVDTGSSAYELGSIFYSDVDGYIVGFRYHKPLGASGTHTASLWSCPAQSNCQSQTGTQLATATFKNETASGPQDVMLTTPVAITHGTNYVVSYHESDGTFYDAYEGLAFGVDNGPLHAPASNSVAGPNALFATGATAYPTANFDSHAYYADVIFEKTLGGTNYYLYNSEPQVGAGATLQAIAAADSNATAYLHVNLMPVGANPAGGLRMDNGLPASSSYAIATLDGNGNAWLGEQGLESGAASQLAYQDYPHWFTAGEASDPERLIYETVTGSYGSDFVFNFVVPNGNYKVRLMQGRPYDGTPSYTTTMPAYWNTRLDLETQWTVKAHNFNFWYNQPAGYQGDWATPANTYIPAKVTNNQLEIALRGVFYQADLATYGANCQNSIPCFAPLLGGLQVMPDSTRPHWVIDTQQTSTVQPGSTLNVYQVDWYTGLSDVQWSLLSGPGSLQAGTDAQGFPCAIYTAPATPPSGDTAVLIQAQSASNPAMKATATLRIASNMVSVK